MSKQEQTVLVTGANSGVGFEAAAQFAEAGYGTIIVGARTEAKAKAAIERLVQRTGKRVFETLAFNTAEVAPAREAADVLRERGTVVDVLVLNAGASSSQPQLNADGVEITYASTLIGHHVLTMRLLEDGGLGAHARIIIAGSEGARGNLPGMTVHDVAAIAEQHFGGDRSAAIVSLAKLGHQDGFSNMDEYVTAKLVVAWWAAALARELPEGMTVNAVSPGAAPASGFARHASAGMKVMLVFMKVLGPLLGMGGSLEAAARRYVEAAERGDDDTGHFYATAHAKKLVGPVGIQRTPEYFLDERSQRAAFDAVVELTGAALPGRVVARAG